MPSSLALLHLGSSVSSAAWCVVVCIFPSRHISFLDSTSAQPRSLYPSFSQLCSLSLPYLCISVLVRRAGGEGWFLIIAGSRPFFLPLFFLSRLFPHSSAHSHRPGYSGRAPVARALGSLSPNFRSMCPRSLSFLISRDVTYLINIYRARTTERASRSMGEERV
jgi:hypothetical protein